MIRTISDRGEYVSAGAKEIYSQQVPAGKKWTIHAISLTFLYSQFAICRVEWGKKGENWRVMEGVSSPARSASKSTWTLTGNGFEQVSANEKLSVSFVTNETVDTVYLAIQVDETDE